MQAAEPPSTPTRIGRYVLVERLAVGGMAEVFLAREPALDRLVVVKRILPHLAQNPDFVQAFEREARIAARIDHPNVVRIFELGEADGLPFIAMEYVDGSTLKHLVVAARQAAVRIPVDAALHLLAQACAGAHVAHELTDPQGRPFGLVHRDISPHNLMVDDSAKVTLLDFGIAKAGEGMDHTRTGLLKGKISYMSPEQCRQERLDRRSDVFALGVVGYELLAGAKPFSGASELATMQAIVRGEREPLRARRPELAPGIERVISKALALSRDERWESADVFRRELEAEARAAGVEIDPVRAGTLVRTLLGERHETRRKVLESAVERTLVSVEQPAPTTELSRTGTSSPSTPATGVSVASGVVASLGALVGLGGIALAVVAIALAALWVAFRGDGVPEVEPEIVPHGEPVVITVAPVTDPEDLERNYAPLRRYLVRALDRPVEFPVASSYDEAARTVATGAAPFAFLPPRTARHAASLAEIQVLAVKVVDGSAGTDGFLLVRRDTDAASVADLKGRTFCLSDPLSSTGYEMPRRHVAAAGLDLDRDFVPRFSGNHHQVLVDLLEGKCDVGATFSGNFTTADQRGVATARLRILAMTGTSPHDAFVAGPGADPELVRALTEALLAFDPVRDLGEQRVGESERITGFALPPDDFLDP